MRHWILDSQGNEQEVADILTWAKWFEGANRHIAKDTYGDVKVSTVFLGIDHSFGGSTPLLYETMVFGGPLDGEQRRYPTRQVAIDGHAAMIARVRAY